MPLPADLAEVFERAAAASPDAIAASSGGASTTYAELDAAAHRLARHLLESGVGQDMPVGLCVPRSLALPVGVLGILGAGAACLPLDPSYPAERLRVMLADAAPPVVLAHPESAGLVEAACPPSTTIINIGGQDRRWPWADAGDQRPPSPVPEERSKRPRRAPGGLAYLLYTSGSTGQPRGVLLGHRALVNHCLAAVQRYDLGPGDRVLQFCSPSFDVSIEELFPTWAAGARVVLRPPELAILGRAWLDWLAAEGVTVLNLPTAYWHAWVRDLQELGAQAPEPLRVVVVGGERATAATYRGWLRVGGHRIRWFNAYGPTEASVMATIHEAAPGWDGDDAGDADPPIGRPLPGVTVHLLDEQDRPVPDGEAGHLHIGGVGLADGYLHQPELTARSFVPDPFVPGARLYRTGDLARARGDGELEFVGRADRQVKVSGGHRVEPGEVEAALRWHPDVSDAVVLAHEDPGGQRRLTGYAVTAPGAGLLPGGLRRHLVARLPSYLVPAEFVLLDEFPMTANGKVDHAALAALDGQRPQAPPTPPRTPTERALAGVWSSVLSTPEIGVDDDLFESGGDSLRAAQIVAAVQDTFGVPVGLATLLAEPTIAALARHLDAEHAHPRTGGPALVAQHRPPGTRVPLSLPQEQMWVLETATGPIANQNVTACYRFEVPVDVEALRAALRLLVDRHEILRTRFGERDGQPFQVVTDDVPVELPVVDLPEGELDGRVAEQDGERFALDQPPLLRARLYRLAGQHGVLAVTFDHLVCDGPSASIALSELTAAHDVLVAGAAPEPAPLAVQYADFARWQHRALTEDRLAAQLDYWRRALAGAPSGPVLPADRSPDRLTRRLASWPLRVGPAGYERLTRLARASQASVFMLCVAAVSAVLARLGATRDVVLSTTLSGRNRGELDGLIGTFAGTGRLRTDLSGDPSFDTAIARARQAAIGLYEHQDIPFSRVRAAVLPELTRSAGGPPLALLPVDLQYFRTAHQRWVPGASAVEGHQLYFRGQLHPCSLALFDDGAQLYGEVTYKRDFYDEETIERLADGWHRLVDAVLADPGQRLSEIPLEREEQA